MARKITKVQLKKRVEQYMAKWMKLLGLEHWCYELFYESIPETDKGQATYAEIQAVWEYKYFDMRVDLDTIRDQGKVQQLERIVRHELAHCLTDPATDIAQWALSKLMQIVNEHQTADIETLPAWDTFLDK